MLKIEVIKFEAQDVITASVTKPACEHNWVKPLNSDKHVCTKCGAQK